MIDYDMLTELSVETLEGDVVVEYFSTAIPRKGEKIEIEDKTYIVDDVIHKVFKYKEDGTKYYVKIKVK